MKFNLDKFNNTLQSIIGNLQGNGWGLWIIPQRKLEWRIGNKTWELVNFGELKDNTLYQIDIIYSNNNYGFSLKNLDTNKAVENFNIVNTAPIVITAEPIPTNSGVITIGGGPKYKFLGTIEDVKSIEITQPIITPPPTTIQTKATTPPPTTTNEIPLYAFRTHKFTNAGARGQKGPTLAEVRNAYLGVSWAQDTTNNYLNMTSNNGIQLWKVPATGRYFIQEITPNYTDLTPKKQEITPKMVHKCNYCLKTYCRANVLKKHLLIYKVKKQDIEEKELILNKLLSTIDQQKEQINQLIKTNENLINQMKYVKHKTIRM